MRNSDFIIVLAWPEGETTAAGAWYDPLFATDGKYRVGHSALILINSKNKELFYFDFGRYHTPPGFGRVRDKETDPDIGIPISAQPSFHPLGLGLACPSSFTRGSFSTSLLYRPLLIF